MLTWRSLPWIMLAAGSALLIILSAFDPFGTSADTSGGKSGRNQPTAREPDHARQKHYVSPRELAASNSMVQRQAGDFSATAQDGQSMDWDDLSGGRPVVLIFVKEGCPCSAEVEPFFQRLEKVYAGETRFADVIDAETEAAASYAVKQGVAHPILADPEQRLIGRFGAKNGCYAVLLTPGGVIDGFWPGCSAETMRQLGRRIAGLAGVEERPLDVSGMPESLTTGCPFKIRGGRAGT
jgi:peroxiredoxin